MWLAHTLLLVGRRAGYTVMVSLGLFRPSDADSFITSDGFYFLTKQ